MRSVVVLPTYNEADNILRALAQVRDSAMQPDIMVVDDSSPDGTAKLVEEFAALHPGRVRLLSRSGKQGLGGAYRAGFATALELGYELVVQMDADGSHPVEALAQMRDSIDAGADLVIGSRYCSGGALDPGWPWYRKALSKGGNAYARRMLGLPVRDLTGGFKMWRADALARLDLGAADAAGYGFQIQTTLAALRTGAVVREVPILFLDRRLGDSKMSNAIILEAMRAVHRMRQPASALRTPQNVPTVSRPAGGHYRAAALGA